VQKQYEALKKRYASEVDQMRSVQEDELTGKNERIVELEQRTKQAEEALEMAKQKWEKDQAIFRQKQEFLDL
jgi:hypothetical protein